MKDVYICYMGNALFSLYTLEGVDNDNIYYNEFFPKIGYNFFVRDSEFSKRSNLLDNKFSKKREVIEIVFRTQK